MFLRECSCEILPFRIVKFHMRWLHVFFLNERELLSLTMSLFCCFSLRDYGSKRKSGKSPVFLHYPSPKLTSPSFLFQLVALNRTPLWAPRGGHYAAWRMTLKLSLWLVCWVMSMCGKEIEGLFTCPGVERWLTVVWSGLKKLPSPLLLALDLPCSPGWGFRIAWHFYGMSK